MAKLKFLLNFALLLHFVMSPSALPADTENPIKREACLAARIDAYRDTNHKIWKASGALFLIFGIVAANIIVPDPPSARLMGKSPEYAEYYLECYKEARSDIQNRDALSGCVYTLTLIVELVDIYYFYRAVPYIKENWR